MQRPYLLWTLCFLHLQLQAGMQYVLEGVEADVSSLDAAHRTVADTRSSPTSMRRLLHTAIDVAAIGPALAIIILFVAGLLVVYDAATHPVSSMKQLFSTEGPIKLALILISSLLPILIDTLLSKRKLWQTPHKQRHTATNSSCTLQSWAASGKVRCKLQRWRVLTYAKVISVANLRQRFLVEDKAVKDICPIVFPRALFTSEQAKMLEACSQSAVAVEMGLAAGPTNITLLGLPHHGCKTQQDIFHILLRAQNVQYPAVWSQVSSQTSNLQLYTVNPASTEVDSIVAEIQRHGTHKVLRIQRVQNKVLYQNFDEQRRRIVNRWAIAEPSLQVMRRLWHGTRATDPACIYSSEEGFSMHYSAACGMWGPGTYFSSSFSFASTYAFHVTGSAAVTYQGHWSRSVRQVLVADVLTGKHKMLSPNRQLRMPPEIENAHVARQLPGAKPRYDSVGGIHHAGHMPVFVTYTSAATSYPSYLVTFQ